MRNVRENVFRAAFADDGVDNRETVARAPLLNFKVGREFDRPTAEPVLDVRPEIHAARAVLAHDRPRRLLLAPSLFEEFPRVLPLHHFLTDRAALVVLALHLHPLARRRLNILITRVERDVHHAIGLAWNDRVVHRLP